MLTITAAPEDVRSADSEQLIKELSTQLGALYDSDGSAGFEPSDVEVPRAAFVVARRLLGWMRCSAAA
jgi:putative acetyltransferase